LHENAHSNQYPNNESLIEVRLKDCRAGLESLVASLQPYAPLDEIDLPRLDSIIGEVKGYILLFDPVVNSKSSNLISNNEIDFLERSCQSASTVHTSLVSAIQRLLTARKALITIERAIKNTASFSVNLQNDYFICLDECRKALTRALENSIISENE
jgi:hypothetical protein